MKTAQAATPPVEQAAAEETVMGESRVGQELREQVAKALGCDPKELAPRR